PLGAEGTVPDSDLAQAASTIKGSFVAVPVHGGTPPPVMTTSWQSESENSFEIRVGVRTSLGDAMRGQEVQFNIDKDIARALNPVLSTDQDLRNILRQTSLHPGVATTNSEGDVTALLVVGDLGLQVP